MFNFIGYETIPLVPLTISNVHGQKCLYSARRQIYLWTSQHIFCRSLHFTNQDEQISQVAKTLKAFLLVEKEQPCSSSMSQLSVFKLVLTHIWGENMFLSEECATENMFSLQMRMAKLTFAALARLYPWAVIVTHKQIVIGLRLFVVHRCSSVSERGRKHPTDVTLKLVPQPTWQLSSLLEFDKLNITFFSCSIECNSLQVWVCFRGRRTSNKRLRHEDLQTLSMHISTLKGECQMTLLDSWKESRKWLIA